MWAHPFEPSLINPVEGGAVRRCDAWGEGHFGAPRGCRVHNGVDIIARPDMPVRSPIHGLVVRVAEPYDDDAVLSGLLLRGLGVHEGLETKLFYVAPEPCLIGQVVQAGATIGRVQSLQTRYPGITDHVHLEVFMREARIDPVPLIPDLS